MNRRELHIFCFDFGITFEKTEKWQILNKNMKNILNCRMNADLGKAVEN